MAGYFEGYYFKQQTRGQTVAVIPAIHRDGRGQVTGSIQLISDTVSGAAVYPGQDCTLRRNPLSLQIGPSTFSAQGMDLAVRQGPLTAEGILRFGPFTPLRGDIMGPFAWVPCLECRHTVVSLTHPVSGSLRLNGASICLDGGVGYVEGDRGRSFPKRYLWAQCSFGADNCLMLSVADIPLLGGAFTGIIGVVRMDGRTHRIATYLGARVLTLGNGAVTVHQGPLTLTAKLLSRREHPLQAPVEGGMTRLIRESVACTASFRLQNGSRTLLELTSDRACFEYEYER